MPPGVAFADTVLVFSMTLSKRGALLFSHTLTRSRSAPVIMMSSISTTSMRVPSVEYTVAISRPMMPAHRPPACASGSPSARSAPVESTTRGSSGMNGSFTAWLPAAMIAFSKRTTFLSPVFALPDRPWSRHLEVMRIEEASDAAHDLDLARLRHAGKPARQLLDHAVLERRAAWAGRSAARRSRCRARRARRPRPSPPPCAAAPWTECSRR